MGFFIASDEARFPADDGIVVSDGDGRTFDSGVVPEQNRVYVEVDFGRGTGFVFSNFSCSDRTQSTCADALVLQGRFSSSMRSDGTVSFNFEIGNSRAGETPVVNEFTISANIDILPVPEGNVCVLGSVSQYPSVEAYYDIGDQTRTIFQLVENTDGGFSLGYPDRMVPACETTEVPPFDYPIDNGQAV